MFKEIEDDKEFYDNVSIKEIIDDDFKRIVFVYAHMYACRYTSVLVMGRKAGESIRLSNNVRVLQFTLLCVCMVINVRVFCCITKSSKVSDQNSSS